MTFSRKCVERWIVRPERVPVDLPVAHEGADVDRAEVADVVRQERLLAAGIGGLVGAEVRDRIVVIGLVDEEHARLAGLPGAMDDLVPHLARLELADDLAGLGMDAGRTSRPASTASMKASVTATEMLKLVILVSVVLAGDELHDVRVVHPQDAHVGAAPGAALLHRRRWRRRRAS